MSFCEESHNRPPSEKTVFNESFLNTSFQTAYINHEKPVSNSLFFM